MLKSASQSQTSRADSAENSVAGNVVSIILGPESSSRIAHSMAARFKDGDKFSENLGEDLTEYICNYMDAAKDYNLTD